VVVQEIPDDDGDMVGYYSCPRLWLNNVLDEFFERREYLQKYPHTADSFGDANPRYIAWDRYYSAKCNEFLALAKREGG
jgi:hypothetical protein